MARRFLYIFAALVVLVFAARVAVSFYGTGIAGFALVPSRPFEAPPALAANAYEAERLWVAHPGFRGDPARFRPEGLAANEAELPAAVFFIHPTSFLDRSGWNGPVDDKESGRLTTLLVRGLASAFNASPALWAPRYRQATFGAFLTDRPEGRQALDLAYHDVEQAFAAFLAHVPEGRPIVLAGHSQGAFHLKRLMRDHVAGKPLARRIAAVYAVGWPLSLAHDLPQMGLPACTAPAQPGCVMSWLSFAEPADTGMMREAYARFPALDGTPPGKSPFLCSNPLTGGIGGSAPAGANLGTFKPDLAMDKARLIPGGVPASCGPDGFLLIGQPPEMGPYALPGNNYHVYDIPLFWANVRADAARRVKAWEAAH